MVLLGMGERKGGTGLADARVQDFDQDLAFLGDGHRVGCVEDRVVALFEQRPGPLGLGDGRSGGGDCCHCCR